MHSGYHGRHAAVTAAGNEQRLRHIHGAAFLEAATADMQRARALAAAAANGSDAASDGAGGASAATAAEVLRVHHERGALALLATDFKEDAESGLRRWNWEWSARA